MDIHDVIQLLLALLGVGSAVLIAVKNKYWIVASLLSQPLWFASAWRADQWGMLLLCLVYTSTTLYAIKPWWIDKNIKE